MALAWAVACLLSTSWLRKTSAPHSKPVDNVMTVLSAALGHSRLRLPGKRILKRVLWRLVGLHSSKPPMGEQATRQLHAASSDCVTANEGEGRACTSV